MRATEVNRIGQCVRVVPSRVRSGQLAAYLAAHRTLHTPAVQRQPGFVSKALVQSEDDPERLVMLLTWQTTAAALAWVAQPEHDEVAAQLRPYTLPAEPWAARGGYCIVEAVGGAQA